MLLEITWRHDQLSATLNSPLTIFLDHTGSAQKFVLKTHREPSCGYEFSGKILYVFFLPPSTMVETSTFLAAPFYTVVYLDTKGIPALPGVTCKTHFLFPIPCIVTKIDA